MKILKFEIPTGEKVKEIKVEDNTVLVELEDPKPKKSKSWEEYCNNHCKVDKNFYISSQGSISTVFGTMDSDKRKNQLPTEEDAEGILALIQLINLHKDWVGSWKKHYSTSHWDIVYNLATDWPGIIEKTNINSILYFPSYQMAEDFLFSPEILKLIHKAKKFI